MRIWRVLFGKELLEMRRSYKLLWVPLVFLLLGIVQPLSTYYMPEILKASGDVPEGFVFPVPTAADVIAQTLSNFGMIGLLVLVLAMMGTVSAERQSGMTGMIMVKPVPDAAYLLSKWAASVVLVWSALILGTAGAWYYTVQLIGSVEWATALEGMLLYGLWITLIVSLCLLLSTWLKSGGAAAAGSLLFAAVLSVVTGALPDGMSWSPARLTGHAGSILQTGEAPDGFALSVGLTFVLIAVVLAVAVYLFKTKEMKAA